MAKAGKKKKKKEKKKKHGEAAAIAETVDPVAAPVADAAGGVAAVDEDVPEADR